MRDFTAIITRLSGAFLVHHHKMLADDFLLSKPNTGGRYGRTLAVAAVTMLLLTLGALLDPVVSGQGFSQCTG